MMRPTARHGLSLLELLAVVSILGVIAIAVVPRLGKGSSNAKGSGCSVNCRIIEIQAALWRRDRGTWPAKNLSNIGADKSYFPEGLPVCPVDQSAYHVDAEGNVIGHNH